MEETSIEDKRIEELLRKSREEDEIESKSNEQDEDSVGDSDVDFDDDLNEEFESIDGDDEIEEEKESEGMESIETGTTEAPTKRKGKKIVKNASGKKRKRKRKDNTKRRDIRKILDESQLEKETLHAQLEEKERLRRLELQKSLATEMTPVVNKDVPNNSVSTENANEPSRSISPMVVDFRQKAKQQSAIIVIDSDDDISVGEQKQQQIEVISSDSVSSSSESDSENSDIDENNVGMHSDDTFNVPNPDGKVEVNINHPLYEDDIYLAPQITKHVKPHQIGGIRFLYDNLVETLARYKVSSGFGCILAHSMGLGKTLQVIAFIDIFLRHTPAKKVLCVVPINTIQNWLAEFNMWLPPKPEVLDQENNDSEKSDSTNEISYRNFNVYQLSDGNKTTISRAKIIGEWNQSGGVLLIGYELYRILAMSTPCMASNKCAPPKRKKSNTTPAVNQEPEVIDLEEEEKNMDFLIGIQHALCKPGPDLVICDEGHRIKNNQSNISQALKKVKTRRRVVLTGYPLQNNLIEYWCMVDFVRPNFLGTRHEFSNMFERPILNGQCSDSTPSDVRLMRYRAHVLHSLLEGFVQRRSQSVLKKCLPFKEEHIVLVKLSPIQSELYNSYISFLLDSVGHLNPIKGFHTCTKIWNHPDVFFASLELKKCGLRNESPLTVLDNDTEDIGASQEDNSNMDPALMLSALPSQVMQQDPSSMSKPTPLGLAWAKDIMREYQPCIEDQGGKIVILMEILDESLSLGEKVLVFSQSLSTLSVIEAFLSKRDIPHFPGRNTMNDPTKWAKNKSYFRLDGSTPSQERDRLITAFNSPDNTDVLLFMLSTRAGCLGVNLIGASRVVVFDASWNPCHDVQAVCRVYRYGQKKPSHIYRLVSTGTMEKKIYDRQVSKQGVANRVVDELNPEANFTKQEIMSLICDKEPDVQAEDVASAANDFSDLVLKRICRNCSNWLSKVPFKHESLLVDKKELKLTKREKREAKKGYEREKNMAQQGGRYNYNPTELKRIPPAGPAPSNIVRPIVAAGPVQLTPPTAMTTIAQRTQAQAFALNLPQASMNSNLRFATLSHNGPTNPIQLRALLPNMSIGRAMNLSVRMPVNPAAIATTGTNPPGSQLRYPLQSAILTNVNQLSMQAGANFASNLVSSLPRNLTNGSIGPRMMGRSFPLLPTSQTRPRTNDVVTIDLDDVPSPPECAEPQNETPNKPQQQEDHVVNMCTEKTSSTADEPVSMATESMVSDQLFTVTPDITPPNHLNTPTSVAAMVTEHVVNNGSPGEPIAMATEVSRGNHMYTSISQLLDNGLESATGTESTDQQLTLAVLQNILNERGGLGASSNSPAESNLETSSPNPSSQM